MEVLKMYLEQTMSRTRREEYQIEPGQAYVIAPGLDSELREDLLLVSKDDSPHNLGINCWQGFYRNNKVLKMMAQDREGIEQMIRSIAPEAEMVLIERLKPDSPGDGAPAWINQQGNYEPYG